MGKGRAGDGGGSAVSRPARLHHPVRRHAQLCQQVFGELRREGLQGNCALHAAQPGGAARFVDRPLGVEGRDGDGTVFFTEQPWAAQPAAEKAGQFIARLFQVFRVHAAQVGSVRQFVHQPVEVVDQAAEAVDTASGLVGGIACAEGEGAAHGRGSLKFGNRILLGAPADGRRSRILFAHPLKSLHQLAGLASQGHEEVLRGVELMPVSSACELFKRLSKRGHIDERFQGMQSLQMGFGDQLVCLK